MVLAIMSSAVPSMESGPRLQSSYWSELVLRGRVYRYSLPQGSMRPVGLKSGLQFSGTGGMTGRRTNDSSPCEVVGRISVINS